MSKEVTPEKPTMARTNVPVIDRATMSPIQLLDAIDSKHSRPLVQLAFPHMLVRDQNKTRDNVDTILNKGYLREIKRHQMKT